MKISGVDIRPGNIIEYEKGIWKVAKTQHTQPGKGGAFMQVEMKNLRDGRKNNVRFRSAESVERVRLDQNLPERQIARNGAQLPMTEMVDKFYAEVVAMGGKRWDTSSLIARLTKD